MANTPNLNLTELVYGSTNWDNTINDDLNKLDSAYGSTDNKIGNLTSLSTTAKDSAVNAINEVNSQLADNTNQINDNSKFVGKFANDLYLLNSLDWDSVYDISVAENMILQAKSLNFQGVIFYVNIQPNRQQRLDFANSTITEDDLAYNIVEGLTNIQNIINLCGTHDIPLLDLKIHTGWANNNWSNLTPSKFFTALQTILDSIFDIVGTATSRITILNEAYTIVADPNSESYIISLLNHIKIKGYKTGLCGIWSDQMSSNLNNVVDFLSVHLYPQLTSKRDKATLDDCLMGWSIQGYIEKLKNYHLNYPTKEIWIMETGTLGYWESLRLPEKYYDTSYTLAPNNLVRRLYFESFFEYFKEADYITGVGAWYFSYSEGDTLIEELFKKYLRRDN